MILLTRRPLLAVFVWRVNIRYVCVGVSVSVCCLFIVCSCACSFNVSSCNVAYVIESVCLCACVSVRGWMLITLITREVL